LSIKIFYDETDYRLKGWRKTARLIKDLIGTEKKKEGELSFIITNDKFLKSINVQFLSHDFNTDVITFNYNSGDIVNGEIYISLDTVRENSFNYNVSLQSEITRVIIHGVLHLLNYDDKSEEGRGEMTAMENLWLKRFKEDYNGIQI
jgi:probable rRNA maturation factor